MYKMCINSVSVNSRRLWKKPIGGKKTLIDEKSEMNNNKQTKTSINLH